MIAGTRAMPSSLPCFGWRTDASPSSGSARATRRTGADTGLLRLLVEQVLGGVLMRLERRRDLRDERARLLILERREQRRRHGVDHGFVERDLVLEERAIESLSVRGLQRMHRVGVVLRHGEILGRRGVNAELL